MANQPCQTYPYEHTCNSKLDIHGGAIPVDFYLPKNLISHIAFEALLSFMTQVLGEYPRLIRHSLANQVLKVVKNDRLRADEKKIAVQALVCKLSETNYTYMLNLCESISDFITDEKSSIDSAGSKVKHTKVHQRHVKLRWISQKIDYALMKDEIELKQRELRILEISQNNYFLNGNIFDALDDMPKVIPVIELFRWSQPNFGSFQRLNQLQKYLCDKALKSRGYLFIAVATNAERKYIAVIQILQDIFKVEYKCIHTLSVDLTLQGMVDNFQKQLKDYSRQVENGEQQGTQLYPFNFLYSIEQQICNDLKCLDRPSWHVGCHAFCSFHYDMLRIAQNKICPVCKTHTEEHKEIATQQQNP